MQTESYLRPDQLTETGRKIMLQIATWDNLEGTWEVVLPLPRSITQTFGQGDEITKVTMEVDAVLEQNGLTYHLFEIDGKNSITINGLKLLS